MKSVSTPIVIINNQVIAVIPGSVSYTEGLGEQTVRVQSAGGGSVQQVYSDNAETKFSTVKLSLINEIFNINSSRGWKTNSNNNTISFVDDDEFTRRFQFMALINDYDVKLSPDGSMDLEFHGMSAV